MKEGANHSPGKWTFDSFNFSDEVRPHSLNEPIRDLKRGMGKGGRGKGEQMERMGEEKGVVERRRSRGDRGK